MKVAQIPTGEQIIAEAAAPLKAICPHCGGVVILRSRRPMNNGKVTYYWRHSSNSNRDCVARNRPAG